MIMKKLLHSPIALAVLSATIIGTGFAVYWKFMRVIPPQYRTQAIERGDISQTVSANGTINPVTLVSVGTQVSGTVKKLFVDFNSNVKKGQILLKLDDALLSAQQKQSLANRQNAVATLELATANEIRAQDLYKQNYISRQELDSAIQAKKSAEAQLQLAQATVEKDSANLTYSVIRSPVSGVVVDRSVDVGQTVAASLQTPTLFKIAQDLSKMQIDANFAEADIGNIRVGQDVKFTVDAFPNRNFKGVVKLIRLNPTSEQNVVTYDVVVNVNNPENLLLPGMTAYVNITVAERKDVLLIPNAALRFKPPADEKQNSDEKKKRDSNSNNGRSGGSRDGKSGRKKHDGSSGKVYVLELDKAKPVKLSLGITDNRNTEVTLGELKEGDKVIVGDSQESSAQSSSRPMRLRMF